jgi:hypothetical protein
MSVRLSLLGQPHVLGGEHSTPLPKKAIGLLAYLATHCDPQPRDRLIELLWPERDPVAGRKDLRNTLWVIRRALGSDVIDSESGYLAIGAGVWTDVQEFAHQVSPDLYRGLFLDGLYFDDAPEFEQWLATEQSRWRDRYRTLTAGTGGAEGATGREGATAYPRAYDLSVFHQLSASPYQPPSVPGLLASGWDLEQQGALAEAAAVYEEVYAATHDDYPVLASHCCLELAVIRLLEHVPDDVGEWLARAGEPRVGDVLAQRFRNSIATILAAQHSDHQTADWFMHQYVLQWRNAARCTLLQSLLARGDLDAEMEAALTRFTAAVH